MWQLVLGCRQFDKESLGGSSIFALLNEDVDDVTVLVHGTPKVSARTLNPDGDFIEKPAITTRPAGLPNSAGKVRTKGGSPLADGFVGDGYATLGKQIFDIPKTECETVIEPNGVGDNAGRKSVSAVA